MLLKLIPNKLKVWLIKHLYADIAEMGDGGDTELAHVNLKEVAILKAHGGAGTLNPRTGLVEFKGKGGGGGGGEGTTKGKERCCVLCRTIGDQEQPAGSPGLLPHEQIVLLRPPHAVLVNVLGRKRVQQNARANNLHLVWGM